MIEHKIEAEAIKSTIEKSNRFLVIAHKRPDGDTLGSICAWFHFLTARGKEVTLYCNDPAPANLQYLPGSQHVKTDPAIFNNQFDCIIVNDSGDLSYAGVDTYLNNRDFTGTTLINVDHHATNPRYGHLNLVIPTASSTTEILARLFIYWNVGISKPMAENLLNGLMTDTDSFTNPATTYQSLVIASELIAAGADLHTIVKRVLNMKSVNDLKLWGLVLSRLKHNPTYKAISTYITSRDIEEYNVSEQSIEGIANYLTLIPTASVILFLRQQNDGALKGSLRTVKANVDVSRLALLCGGGGHKKASGFRINGSLRVEGERWTIV